MHPEPHILIAIPYEPARDARWPTKAMDLAARLPAANPGIAFGLALHPAPRTALPGDGRYSANARARNALLDTWLHTEGYTHILWVDSDLEHYPADLPSHLLTLNPDGISAPAALLDQPGVKDRFYDILGYIDLDGRGAAMTRPWFRQAGPVVDLLSVGCCYLAPAGLYRDGARYADAPDYTEHWPVMRAARTAGLRICADLSRVALHAWLPRYGEALH